MAKAERMEITTEKFRSKLETAIKRDANFIKAHQNEVDLASVAVETMSAMDPSQNGKYLVWLTLWRDNLGETRASIWMRFSVAAISDVISVIVADKPVCVG